MTADSAVGPRWLRPADAAERLDVTPRSIYDLIDRGVLHAARSAEGGVIVAKADVEAAISARSASDQTNE